MPILLILIGCLLWQQGQSQIRGQVLAEGQALPYASIYLVESPQFQTLSNDSGYFELASTPPLPFTLRIEAIGYQSFQKRILRLGQQDSLILLPSSLGLDEVVVTGALRSTRLSQSPVKVDLIQADYFMRNLAPTQLVEALTLVNGVQEQISCGVCGTNSLRINGLPGQYTAILIDGMPLYGNLASVYGLNSIPASLIEQVEIIKGPSSTLYGSEAVAGLINVRTRAPKDLPLWAGNLMLSSHREVFHDLSFSPKLGKKGYLSLGLQHAHLPDYSDFNADGFGDRVQLDRVSAFAKYQMPRASGQAANVFLRYYYEDRRNGLRNYVRNRAYRQIRGNDSIYGESIYTHRIEALASLPLAKDWKWDLSASWHGQDSYYGADRYEAQQALGFSNLFWSPTWGAHQPTFGLTLRYQYYNDNTVVTQNRADHSYLLGLFAQDEWTLAPNRRWVLLYGARLDYYPRHGLIPAPRINLLFKPSTWSSLRWNLGTGFRVVNLFAEDHAFVTGNRQVLLAEELRPERSWNSTLNYNQIFQAFGGQGSFDIDAFFTHFSNAIFPDYDTEGLVIYANSRGYLQTQGISVAWQHELRRAWSWNLSWQFQQTRSFEAGMVEDLPFVPRWSGVAVLNYEWRGSGWLLSSVLRYTGRMNLPKVFDVDGQTGQPNAEPRPLQSRPFVWHNLQAQKEFKRLGWTLYFGIQNIWNVRQRPFSPLTGYNDPNFSPGFSPYFDTAYAYAPMEGREFYLGLRWRWK
jgi:outer membrane receptor for ferrienterochelin and colicins